MSNRVETRLAPLWSKAKIVHNSLQGSKNEALDLVVGNNAGTFCLYRVSYYSFERTDLKQLIV